MEQALLDLWKDDPQRKRQHGVAMFDIDRFGRALERHGAVACDCVLSAFAGLLGDSLRQNRGYDVLARYDGQRFVILLGDTGVLEVVSAAERIRETISESVFKLDGKDLELTASCGVTDVRRSDTVERLFERLTKTTRAAKKAGRNQTFADESNQPREVSRRDHDVRGREISVSLTDARK
jgi:diguanylate cyclase (GGDEF)-like protein